MNQRTRDARTDDGVGRLRSASAQQRSTPDRSTDGADRATRIDVALVCCSIGLSLVAIPLLVGYAFVAGTVPSPGAAAFYALGAVVMAPGPLMGATALWLCARSSRAH